MLGLSALRKKAALGVHGLGFKEFGVQNPKLLNPKPNTLNGLGPTGCRLGLGFKCSFRGLRAFVRGKRVHLKVSGCLVQGLGLLRLGIHAFYSIDKHRSPISWAWSS